MILTKSHFSVDFWPNHQTPASRSYFILQTRHYMYWHRDTFDISCHLKRTRRISRTLEAPSLNDATVSTANTPSRSAAAAIQGLTLVHFSAQLEPFLTQNTP